MNKTKNIFPHSLIIVIICILFGIVHLTFNYNNVSSSSSPVTSSDPTCANSGGAMSLGWILCPLLDFMGDAAEKVYDEFVEPSLQVEPQLFSQDPNEGTLKAWTVFQTIANTVFIILVLIVVFSQLTGVGIDNYGIKKILPKLIIAAVLVNLSYFICQLCIDLSNIIGNGFQEIFDNLSTGTPTLSIPNATLPTVTMTGFTGVAILSALAVMTGVIWQNPAIILSLLVSALGIVIAIFFLFILLSARQAAIVVLTVVSPIAFVCYVLPNTKKIFDKWIKFGEGLLLVYPICGLLVGGGDYVSRLLLSSGFAAGGFVSALTAMIVGVLPIFFIPTVLKGAFSAMGNLGAQITGFGNRMRSGATNKLRNAEGYKNAQRTGLERRARIKAGYNEKTGELNGIGRAKARFANTRFGKGIGYGRTQAAYIEQAKKISSANEEASASLTNALASSEIAANGGDVQGYYRGALAKAGQSGNVSDIKSVISAMINSGQMKDKEIAKAIRDALNDGSIKIETTDKNGNKVMNGSMSNMLREVAAAHGGVLGADAELLDFARKGGNTNRVNGNEMLGDYGEYGKANMDSNDIKKEDVLKLSGDSLAGLIKSKLIDEGMADQMLAMNPNISNDKKIMLGAAKGEGEIDLQKSAAEIKAAAEAIATGQAVGQESAIKMEAAVAAALTSAIPQSVRIVQDNPREIQIDH